MPNSISPPDHASADRWPILIPPRVWDVLDSYDKNLQAKFIKAFRLMSKDLRYPSLNIEIIKVHGRAFYRARVDPQYRVHFELRNNCYAILAVSPHNLQGIG